MKKIRQLTPVPFSRVSINRGFWGDRVRVNRDVTLPIEYDQCKSTGRIDAFKLDWQPGATPKPHYFWDSDVAKWIEAASYSIATHPDKELEKKLDKVIDLIASAQQADGYLNIYFSAVAPDRRWSNLRDQHELYCAGHLIEAAVAHHDSTGNKKLLDIMCRYANYITTIFGRGRKKKRGYPGHEEIELALVKLYRATDDRRYLDLASYFVDERGQEPHYFDIEAKKRGEDPKQYRGGGYDYCQAHQPVRKQKTADGHAVRACYLYAGIADVAAETGDKELIAACKRIWKNITEKRMYIHGGIGSTRFNERFTMDYDLPNEEAYAETCAAIALVFFGHRMLQIDPDGKYADVIERALYNCIPSGVSLDGERFFYDNYLASVPGVHRFTGQKPPVRQEWFDCACCPPNLARLFASLGGYIYSQKEKSVYVHHYTSSTLQVEIDGQEVQIDQTTEYPWNGKIQIKVSSESPTFFTLALRIPGWCSGGRIRVNDDSSSLPAALSKGYHKLSRKWQPGDVVDLDLDMPVERVKSHPSVRHNAGRVALQRGPVVYCLEEKDNGKDLYDIRLPRKSALTIVNGTAGVLKDIPLICGKAYRRDKEGWKGSLYRVVQSEYVPSQITAIPYFMWANRGEGEMIVWIGESG